MTTLFKYFPSKESILFDQEPEVESGMVAAVIKNAGKKPVLEALRQFFLRGSASRSDLAPHLRAFFSLVQSTPELASYSRQLWTRYESALARAIQETVRPPAKADEVEAIAHLALESVVRATTAAVPVQLLKARFKILKRGFRR